MEKEIEEFEKWWDSEWETLDAPYNNQSSMYYAWLAWNAARKVEREECANLVESFDYVPSDPRSHSIWHKRLLSAQKGRDD